MARHLDHLTDYLWKKDEGMLMNGTNGAQVWDTAFSIQAIVDTGLADDPRYQPTLMKALEFLKEHQIRDDCREQEKERGPSAPGNRAIPSPTALLKG
ncbi:hypothetical protein ACHAPS_003016 [Verticillium nonalfalfae]